MVTHKNCYQTLGLLPEVDDVVIKAAYKALAQKHHPDKYKTNKDLHTQKMAELNAAYAAIGTKSKRKAYDESLHKTFVAKQENPKKHKQDVCAHAELIRQLEVSVLDEMVVVALFEKHFSTNVKINSGWVNTYSIKQGNATSTFDFSELKLRIIEKLKQQ